MIIYTCICDIKDELRDPLIINDNVKYICYTDQKIKSNVWDVRPLLRKFDDGRLTARWHKTIGCNFQEDDIIVWQDGNVQLEDTKPLVDSVRHDNIGLMKHPARKCIKKEGKAILDFEKSNMYVVNKQLDHYFNDGLTLDWGLFATCVIVRKNNDRINAFNNIWWNHILRYTDRDQLSLPYILWKYDFNYSIIPNNCFNIVGDHLIKKRVL